jgi:hypothetical protein
MFFAPCGQKASSTIPIDYLLSSIFHLRIFPRCRPGLASASVGIFDSHTMPVALILATTSWIGFAILLIGKRSIHGLRYVEEKGANPLPH